VKIGADLIFAGLLEQPIPLHAGGHSRCPGAQRLRLINQDLLGIVVFEKVTRFHARLSSIGGKSANGVLITDKSHEPRGDNDQ